jgi:hypothetical protein
VNESLHESFTNWTDLDRFARKRIRRAGRYRWTVRGVDGQGRRVVSASRSFRVKR